MLSYEHFGISFTGCVKPYSLIISLSYMPFCFVLFFYILTTLGITFELYYLMSSLCYVVRIWTVGALMLELNHMESFFLCDYE